MDSLQHERNTSSESVAPSRTNISILPAQRNTNTINDYDKMLATAKHAELSLRHSPSASAASSRLKRCASYDSVRENLQVSQTFTSSTSRDCEQLDSPGHWVLHDTFERWKVNGFRQIQSHSLTNLRSWFGAFGASTPDDEAATMEKSTLERLPQEVMDQILRALVVMDQDLGDTGLYKQHSNLLSCLLVSKTMFTATLPTLYEHISIPHPVTFSKAVKRVREDGQLAPMIKRLDFSHYTNIGWSRSRQQSSEARNLNPTILLECLDMMVNLQEFLVHEHLDGELDVKVLTKLATMPSMRALDCCASASRAFVEAFSTVATTTPAGTMQAPRWRSIERLSLHECSTLPGRVFESLLPQLPRLTHLDVAHTLVTDKALSSIPATAELTHLNLSRCTQLTSQTVVEFLTSHDAVRDTLVCLNLMFDSARYKLLAEDDVTALLSNLPNPLRSLNLGGASINDTHIPLLLPLVERVEELGLSGAKLTTSQILTIFKMPSNDGDAAKQEKPRSLSVRYLDLSNLLSLTDVNHNIEPLLSMESLPLEVIEIGDKLAESLKPKRPSHTAWATVEFGRRGWYARQVQDGQDYLPESPDRSWKMGAKWWGAKKMPVAVQKVGGVYGAFMFKR